MMEKKKKNNLTVLNTVQNKELSIQFSLDGFSFCIFNLDLKEYSKITSYHFKKPLNSPEQLLQNIEYLFSKDKNLTLKYKRVKVIHANNLVSFVPQVLFDENNISKYVAFNNKLFNNDFFTYDVIENHDINAVFIPYININNYLIDHFGSFVYKHESSIITKNLLTKFTINKDAIMFVNVSGSFFEIIVIANKKLLFFNTFSYTSKEDFLYYILFTFEQLDLDTEKTNVNFLGQIKKDDELYNLTCEYIENVNFIKNNFNFNRTNISDTNIRENFALFHFN